MHCASAFHPKRMQFSFRNIMSAFKFDWQLTTSGEHWERWEILVKANQNGLYELKYRNPASCLLPSSWWKVSEINGGETKES